MTPVDNYDGEPEDRSNDTIRISCQEANGTSKGGIFKDGIWHKHRWHGSPSSNHQEDMVCLHDLETGSWFLIHYVLPRMITGSSANDSLFDEASVACRRTPVQAMHWFQKQSFGPPPQLVARVERFARDWPLFVGSGSCRELLQKILDRDSLPDDDPSLSGDRQRDLDLLERLDLANPSDSPRSYFAPGPVRDMGVEGFISWMNGHLRLVGMTTSAASEHPAEDRQQSRTRGSPIGPQMDARDAFHRATLFVYEDLGALVAILKSEPDRRVALLHLDELIHRHEAPAPGDSDLVAQLKTGVGRLRSSLATVMHIQDQTQGVGGAFWLGRRDRTWGGINSGSYHNVAIGAANAMLEAGSEGFTSVRTSGDKPRRSGIIRRLVIEAAMDPNSWRQLGDELRREFELASLVPARKLSAEPESGSESPRPQKPTVDVAIAAFRAAHEEWHRATPDTGASITALDAEGHAFTRSYWLPSGAYFEAKTPEEEAPFGFAKPDWSSLPQPILRPTDEEWCTAHDACAEARVTLAGAADQLAVAVDGTDNAARHLRDGALRLAVMLRDVPPVWPTKTETDLAFEINNNRIVEFRQAIAEDKRQREAADAAATEERRKQKAEQAADALIEWRAAQHSADSSATDRAPSPNAFVNKPMTVAQAKKHKRLEAIREILRANGGTELPHKDIVKSLAKLDITCRVNTVTHDLRAIRAEQR